MERIFLSGIGFRNTRQMFCDAKGHSLGDQRNASEIEEGGDEVSFGLRINSAPKARENSRAIQPRNSGAKREEIIP